ncbi:hypothetical protein M3J09_013299 [Ascochyta lentis]
MSEPVELLTGCENDTKPYRESHGSTLRMCPRCAVINPRTFFKHEKGFHPGSPSSWNPHNCDMCDFFYRCLQSPDTPSQTTDGAVHLPNYRLCDSLYPMGVVRQALPVAGLEDGHSYCEITEKGNGRTLVHSLIGLPHTDITPPFMDWGVVRGWLRSAVEETSAVQANTPSRSAPSGLSTSRNRIAALNIIYCESRTLL